MKASEAFPSRYLQAADLEPGQTVTVTIDRVVIETVGQGRDEEERPVVYFHGGKKGLVLNKTNTRAIVKALDEDEMDNWPGEKIQVFRTTCEFKGDTVDCIRVRGPAASKPRPKVDAEDGAAEDGDCPW